MVKEKMYFKLVCLFIKREIKGRDIRIVDCLLQGDKSKNAIRSQLTEIDPPSLNKSLAYLTEKGLITENDGVFRIKE